MAQFVAVRQPKLRVIPCDYDEAVAFVARHHRHHKPPCGHKFSLAVSDETETIRAVCMVGRPVARGNDDGMTLEVTRLASDGCPNACSCLYGAAWRATKALGYGRLITYILDTEPGTTLTAAGWKCVGKRGGGQLELPEPPARGQAPDAEKVFVGCAVNCTTAKR